MAGLSLLEKVANVFAPEKDPLEEWRKERIRTRVFPEPCPSKKSEVDFNRAKYILDGKEFRFRDRGCSCHANLVRSENGVDYTIQPGTEVLCYVIYDVLVDTINTLNKEEGRRLITEVKIEKDNVHMPAGITQTGEVYLSQNPFQRLTDDEKRELIVGTIIHEAGHRKYEGTEHFKKLFEEAVKLGIINWFRDSNFYRINIKSKNWWSSEAAGHPEDSPTEFYASAYMISKRYRGEFNKLFYANATLQQKEIVDAVFENVR